MRRIIVFKDTFPLLGPVVWMLSVQYFLVQIVVANAWRTHYSWHNNFISDLGNTVCGSYKGVTVCSPLHSLMNASFILFGITMMIGALLIYTEFRESKLSLIGFSTMALSGTGTLLVGVFPENTDAFAHTLGAFLSLCIGNVSLVILAIVLKRVRYSFRVYTFVSGFLSLVAFGLFVTNHYLGFGVGGMERLVSYPLTVWLILFGLYMTAVRVRNARRKV